MSSEIYLKDFSKSPQAVKFGEKSVIIFETRLRSPDFKGRTTFSSYFYRDGRPGGGFEFDSELIQETFELMHRESSIPVPGVMAPQAR